MTTKIKATNIWKKFNNLEVLKGIDLEVNEGEVVAVIGPSGGGKSTLLRCLNKLETIDKGSITIDGEELCRETSGGTEYVKNNDVRRIACKMGMVFQQFNLFPHMTVLENLIEAPVNVQKRDKAEVIKEAEVLLAKVGLSEKRDVYPRKLSGGQQQRVAIARALAMKPAIMLFDEPTSSLDPELTGEVLRTMR
ncbi:amino acid ABC transporter ATP-binding protein, partial [Phascolarctobacterium succinatutens]